MHAESYNICSGESRDDDCLAIELEVFRSVLQSTNTDIEMGRRPSTLFYSDSKFSMFFLVENARQASAERRASLSPNMEEYETEVIVQRLREITFWQKIFPNLAEESEIIFSRIDFPIAASFVHLPDVNFLFAISDQSEVSILQEELSKEIQPTESSDITRFKYLSDQECSDSLSGNEFAAGSQKSRDMFGQPGNCNFDLNGTYKRTTVLRNIESQLMVLLAETSALYGNC